MPLSFKTLPATHKQEAGVLHAAVAASVNDDKQSCSALHAMHFNTSNSTLPEGRKRQHCNLVLSAHSQKEKGSVLCDALKVGSNKNVFAPAIECNP